MKYVSEIKTNLQDYFYEGNISLQFLGYIQDSFKLILWNRFANLGQCNDFITTKFPLDINKEDKINHHYIIPSIGIINILMG